MTTFAPIQEAIRQLPQSKKQERRRLPLEEETPEFLAAIDVDLRSQRKAAAVSDPGS